MATGMSDGVFRFSDIREVILIQTDWEIRDSLDNFDFSDLSRLGVLCVNLKLKTSEVH